MARRSGHQCQSRRPDDEVHIALVIAPAIPDTRSDEEGLAESRRLSGRFERAFYPDGGDLPASSGAGTQRAFRVLVFGLFLVYMGIAVGVYLWRGIFFRPDQWAVFLLVGALVLGRVGPFLRDWIPFVLLVFGYEFLRGVAGDLVLHGTSVRSVERVEVPNIHLEGLMRFDLALFAGHEPLRTLQGWFYDSGTVHWYDYFALIVYSLHFVLPCVFGFALWLTQKERFWHFTLAFCFMTYAAFAFFLFYPAAPPWLAQIWGLTHGLHFPQNQVTAAINIRELQGFDAITIWAEASPHPVAAFPSLHAGFPWLVTLFAVRYFRWWGLLFLPYNLALWFAVMYTANHWVVDILAGVAWATISFVVVDIIWHAITVDNFANIPQPLKIALAGSKRFFVDPVVAIAAPFWNAPGRARAWMRHKLRGSS